MKVLVTASPQLTHVWDVVPISWALRSAGHDVRVSTLQNVANHVVDTSLTAMPVAARLNSEELPLADPDAGLEARIAAFARSFAMTSGLLYPGLVRSLELFRPDVVIHEPSELAGPMLAQQLEVPAIHQSWGPPLRPRVARALHRAATGLRRRFGLPESVAPPALVLDVCPPSYRYEEHRIDAPHQSMRYVPFNGPGAVPAWLSEPRERPRVCVTLGTVLPFEGGVPLLHRLVEAISVLDLDIVVPLRPESVPDVHLEGRGIRVMDWLPLKLLADSCDLVIHQGGPGTILTLLNFGVPQIAVPVFGDEYINARLLRDCGAGIKLDHQTMTDDDIVSAVRRVLHEPSYRAGARALAREIAAQPSPAEAATVVNDLVTAGRLPATESCDR